MAGLIGTVHMRVAGFAALVAMGDDLIGNPFATAVVKYKVLAAEFVLQPLCFRLTGILDDAALQLIDLFKAFVFIVGAGLFTTYAARAVHNQFFVFFMVFKVVFDKIKGIAEGIYIWGDRIFKMPDLALIMVAHIHQDGIFILNERIKGFGIQVNPFIGHIKGVIVQPICNLFYGAP